uniref:cytochrome c oxidase subunit III n=1 Tax=Laemobothrion tinnunculi TaxID=1941263 RepID=UPI0021D52682|nr:cytochrome c oxidase subunit III [Laemobothrion tinnunculi]UXC94699.1 cytochrome c oxidase subunit III [Laemobothrion tinnunculi]UXC94712.1 cytochrome c oxidase subunit III [Laemobothrion tinnunculi]
MSNLLINPYSAIERSPWPFLISISLLNLFSSMIMMFNKKLMDYKMVLCFFSFSLIVILWMQDLENESMCGMHTIDIQKGMKLGMILFISSEIMFFFSFFWGYFHFFIAPLETWPPLGIKTIDPLKVPLLSTLILVTSGVTLNISHFNLMNNKCKIAKKFLLITVIFGFFFTILQLEEFYESYFVISDGIYGALFYITTGFHGIHVILGSLMLLTNYTKFFTKLMSCYKMCSFEISAWYWHFVDVVWLFLYLFLYWGSMI